LIDGLPGIGFPQWRVELLRIRNGRSGVWDLKWRDGRFHGIEKPNFADVHMPAQALTDTLLGKTG
jgi:hypothetical protein